MITPVQVKMARAALGWGIRDLAKRVGVANNTISRFENDAGTTVKTLGKIQTALENAGVEFIAPDGTKGPGVRLTRDVDLTP